MFAFCALFLLHSHNPSGPGKISLITKNKMDNPRFVKKEVIPLFQDEDYDNCGPLNTSRLRGDIIHRT